PIVPTFTCGLLRSNLALAMMIFLVYVEPPTNGAELTQFIDISPKKN
ncbi:hypothetical protein J471_4400, partial [Acinetobacter baumannii 1032359]